MNSSAPAAVAQGPIPEVSIIVPARNEEASLGACLQSLTAQTGAAFEIIVVDDASTDRTRAIAESFAEVRVISPVSFHEGWTGKNNAVVAGVKETRASWLLFTDADTVHQPGSLARALAEAKREQADLLSYSPEQVVVTFTERFVMPAVFAELAAQYPLRKVRDQISQASSETVAANGQYILLRRAPYEALGGHAAVAGEILEDLALARLFHNAGHRVFFRYGGDAVRTRMYRNWPQVRDGWTRNLALAFSHVERLALKNLFLWLVAWLAIVIAVAGALSQHFVWIFPAVLWLLVYRRIRAAHFAAANNLLAMIFGLPMFAFLLLRSGRAHATGKVSWKGRAHSVGARTPEPGQNAGSKSSSAESESSIASQEPIASS